MARPSNPALKHSKANMQPETCTLKDLCPADKQKVANLIKQVVELGQEITTLKQQHDQAVTGHQQWAAQLQGALKEVVDHNAILKTRLSQMLSVVHTLQHKVHTLEAAQPAAPSRTAASPAGMVDPTHAAAGAASHSRPGKESSRPAQSILAESTAQPTGQAAAAVPAPDEAQRNLPTGQAHCDPPPLPPPSQQQLQQEQQEQPSSSCNRAVLLQQPVAPPVPRLTPPVPHPAPAPRPPLPDTQGVLGASPGRAAGSEPVSLQPQQPGVDRSTTHGQHADTLTGTAPHVPEGAQPGPRDRCPDTSGDGLPAEAPQAAQPSTEDLPASAMAALPRSASLTAKRPTPLTLDHAASADVTAAAVPEGEATADLPQRSAAASPCGSPTQTHLASLAGVLDSIASFADVRSRPASRLSSHCYSPATASSPGSAVQREGGSPQGVPKPGVRVERHHVHRRSHVSDQHVPTQGQDESRTAAGGLRWPGATANGWAERPAVCIPSVPQAISGSSAVSAASRGVYSSKFDESLLDLLLEVEQMQPERGAYGGLQQETHSAGRYGLSHQHTASQRRHDPRYRGSMTWLAADLYEENDVVSVILQQEE